VILQALYELAEREHLGGDFREEVVDLLVHIDRDGKLVAIVPTAGEDGRSRKMLVPLRSQRSGKRPPPYFLVDNALYVLGIAGADAKTGKARKSEAAAADRAAAYAAFLEQVIGEDQDPGLAAARRFCTRVEENRAIALAALPGHRWTGSEWTALVLEDDESEAIHLRPAARAAWARQRASASDDAAMTARCLVTGVCGPIARVHRMPVKNVPGGKIGGTALVSFNAPAFESHGLEQATNAPVTIEAAEKYVAALNMMLERPPGGTRRYRQGIPLGDSVLLVWTRDPTPEIESLLDLLSDGRVDPADVESVVLAPWRGVEPSVDVTPFYGLTLSGAQARAFVRSWFTSTLGEVKRNVVAWFDALALDRGPPALAMWQLLAALKSPGDSDAPPVLASRLAIAALFGGPLPRDALRHALMRLRVPTEAKQNHVMHVRIALVKAVLIRTYQKEVSMSLDPKCRDQTYLLGRLFAVLERLQAAALNDLNATIRDRYFGSASSTPATVFPRLLRLSIHHAAKAERAGWLEKLKGEIIDALPAQQFPNVLGLEQQGMFAVGYYHQRETFFKKPAGETSSSTSST
jgi:CRISPR-associated protein Csd1